MAEADGNVKSTLKKPLFCAEWTAVIPSYEDGVTLSPVFHLKSIQCQFKLLAMDFDEVLFLEVVRSDDRDIVITEFYMCTVIVRSEFDLKLPPPVRERIDLHQEECLWKLDMYDLNLELERIQGKTISFLVVLEEDGKSTQEREGDWDWSLSTKSLHSLSGDFVKLLDDTRTADIKLLCGDLTIPAHGSILSARSEVFEKMLQTDMVERRTGTIKIPDIEPQIIKEFLRYLYTGTLPEMTVEKALGLYKAGDKYNVQSLVTECNNYLGSCLAVDSACNVLVLADNHGDSELKKRAIDFIAQLYIPLMPGIWKKFSDERPKLALEAMQCAYEYKHAKRRF